MRIWKGIEIKTFSRTQFLHQEMNHFVQMGGPNDKNYEEESSKKTCQGEVKN